MLIGEKLKFLRENHDLLQKDIADYLKVKQETYSSYERDRTEPNLQTLKMLCEYYNVSADFFIEPKVTITNINLTGLTERDVEVMKYLVKKFNNINEKR